MSKRDYYNVLGVSKTSTDKEIKRAYRKLAKENHPDVKPNDVKAEELFKEAAEAYEILSDSDKRRNYDRNGHTNNRNYSEDDVFNHFRRRQQIIKGQNLRINLKLTLEDIFNGIKKTIKYKKSVTCDTCDGNGGHDIVTCDVCNGSGATIITRRFGNHMIQQQQQCGKCHGTGSIIKNICKTCKGTKYNLVDETLDIEIPIGVHDGMSLMHEGGGHSIKDGVDGDIIVVITEINHDTLERSGNDLKLKLKLSYSQLVLGDKVEVPTIEGGKIRLTIPPYSKVGDNLRVPAKGMYFLQSNTNRGDLIIILQLSTPTKISDEEKELLIKLDKFRV